MFRPVKPKVILLVLVICLPLIACGSRVEEVTNIDQIVGTWEGETSPGTTFFISIQSDGTMKMARTLENLNKGSTDTYELWIEDDQIVVHSPIICSEGDGLYRAVIQPDGNLRFTTIDDPCEFRTMRFAKSLPESGEQYIVEFSPFDNP